MFANNIRFLREQKGLSQEELAEKLGYKSFSTIAKWESGIAEPPIKTVKILAEYFNSTVENLIQADLNTFNISTVNKNVNDEKIIPILGDIVNYENILSKDNIESTLMIGSFVNADCCVKEPNEAMIDIYICPNDLLLIKRVENFIDGAIYAVILQNECRPRIKQIFVEDNYIILLPRNGKYRPIITSKENVICIGRCVGIYRNL